MDTAPSSSAMVWFTRKRIQQDVGRVKMTANTEDTAQCASHCKQTAQNVDRFITNYITKKRFDYTKCYHLEKKQTEKCIFGDTYLCTCLICVSKRIHEYFTDGGGSKPGSYSPS